jgi:hypothetical protein
MRVPRLAAFVAFAVLAAYFVPIQMNAQTATTSLRGVVSDPAGAVVAGATIVVSNPETGFSQTTTTDHEGSYQFLQLPPATYIITTTAAGFAPVKQEGVRLLVNVAGTLNVKLQVKGESIQVEVVGNAELVNTQDATLGHAFGREKIEALPFEGRDPVGILSLQPGVVFTGSSTKVDTAIDSRSGAVNGARSDQTNVTLDGVDNNDQLTGVAFTGAVRSTLDSLQEFRVTTANSNADEGRSSGAQVSLVTKSGTNKFHGSAYEYHRPTFGTANDWFNKQSQLASGLPNRPGKLIRNTFGATVGGPIVKNRVFFFGAYEGQRTRENVQVTRVVPSENLRAGTIQYLTCGSGVPTDCDNPTEVVSLTKEDLAGMDPNCSAPLPGFPQGTCPLGPGANSAVMEIFQQYPLPNSTAAGDGLNFGGFSFSAPSPKKQDTYILKFDFNVTKNGNHRAFVRGGLNNDHVSKNSGSDVTQTGDAGPEFPGLPQNITELRNSKSLIVSYNSLFRNNLINSFRYGFIRQGIETKGLKEQHFVQFRGLDNPLGFDTSTATIVPVHNFADDFTWVKGNHTLQFGVNYRRIDNQRTSNSTSFFTATTNVSWLDNAGIAQSGSSLDPGAFGFPDVSDSFTSSYDSPMAALAGLVTEVDANYNLTKTLSALPEGSSVPRHFRDNELEFYGQDSWRVTPNLTLTFGLRYTLLQPPYETTGTQVAPDVSLNEFFNRRGKAMLAGETYNPLVSFSLSGQANKGKPYWDWDYKNIAPRFAFAYSPNWSDGWLGKLTGGTGHTSIRGGYGMYFDHFGQGIVNTFDRNGSFGLTTAISNPAGVQSVDTSARFTDLFTIPTQSAACATPPCNLVAPPPSGSFPVTPPSTLDSGGFAITWGLDDKLKTPYSHVVDFSVQRELPKGFVVEASYVGRFAHRLLQEDDVAMPLNLVDPNSGMDYFTAATMLNKAAQAGVDIADLGPIPFWENVFPNAAGVLDTANFGCSPGASGFGGTPTATQAMYDMYACFVGNETTALFFADLPDLVNSGTCFPACATLNGVTAPFQFFDPQWSSLYAWRSIGNSSYNAAQLSLRKAMAHGLQFDLNYTFSKSIDLGSNAERISEFEGFGFSSQIINAWAPRQNRSVSDFDARHQINANWVYELPFGRGRTYGGGANAWTDAFLGGWQVSGLLRFTSGLPFSVGPGLGFWPTNWQLTSSTVLEGKRPTTGSFLVDGAPNVFKDPKSAIDQFRFAYPGETGDRNNLRGPGYWGLDMGIAKIWKIRESNSLRFSWEVFNVTNSPVFDAASANLQKAVEGSFGNFTKLLSDKRVMQFSLRYSF